MNDGPHNYYLPNKPEPVLREIEGNRVWFIGDDAYTPIALCAFGLIRMCQHKERTIVLQGGTVGVMP